MTHQQGAQGQGKTGDMRPPVFASDRLGELKAYSALTPKRETGRGSSQNGGTPAKVGHLFAFGNTEERLRLQNLG